MGPSADLIPNDQAAISIEAVQNHDLMTSPFTDVDQPPRGTIELPNSESRPSLFLAPKEPHRATPNSGKKRAGPNLTRLAPASSHRIRMSAIFEDASKMIHPISTPSPLSAHARRLRMPLARTSCSIQEPDKDIVLVCNAVALPRAENWPQPDSETSSPMNRPIFTHRAAQHGNCGEQEPSYSSVSLQSRSTTNGYSGVEPTRRGYASPIAGKDAILTMAQAEMVGPDLTDLSSSVVDRHLEAVTHISDVEHNLRSAKLDIGNQVNRVHGHSPFDSAENHDSSPSRRPETVPPSGNSTPSRQSPVSDLQDASLEGKYPPRRRPAVRHSPGDSLPEPPRHKIPRPPPIKGTSSAKQDHGFVIYEDGASDQSMELSPSVERYRKGRRPQRERCMSYWDEDILSSPRDFPKREDRGKGGRQVLGDLPSLTKAKCFIKDAEEAQFDFKAELKGFDA
ncbi:MAG: hypothetical protein L6R39_000677 [Caloplaca ligustica]|nr:MAG: hypothetical protein L6R39_000677 [Caloplaca ligustica]